MSTAVSGARVEQRVACRSFFFVLLIRLGSETDPHSNFRRRLSRPVFESCRVFKVMEESGVFAPVTGLLVR